MPANKPRRSQKPTETQAGVATANCSRSSRWKAVKNFPAFLKRSGPTGGHQAGLVDHGFSASRRQSKKNHAQIQSQRQPVPHECFCPHWTIKTNGKWFSEAKPLQFSSVQMSDFWHVSCGQSFSGLEQCSLPATCHAASFFQSRPADHLPGRDLLFLRGFRFAGVEQPGQRNQAMPEPTVIKHEK